MIQITCKGNSAICTRTERLTSGMVGLQCEFVFDGAWDGLARTAVFWAGNQKRDVLLTGDTCTVPWEVLKTAGYQLVIGVYGTNAAGTLVIPTVYAMCGGIASGADPSGDESTDPTLPVWGQMQGMIGDLGNLATSSKDNLVAAINEAAQSGGGISATEKTLLMSLLNNAIYTTDMTEALAQLEAYWNGSGGSGGESGGGGTGGGEDTGGGDTPPVAETLPSWIAEMQTVEFTPEADTNEAQTFAISMENEPNIVFVNSDIETVIALRDLAALTFMKMPDGAIFRQQYSADTKISITSVLTKDVSSECSMSASEIVLPPANIGTVAAYWRAGHTYKIYCVKTVFDTTDMAHVPAFAKEVYPVVFAPEADTNEAQTFSYEMENEPNAILIISDLTEIIAYRDFVGVFVSKRYDQGGWHGYAIANNNGYISSNNIATGYGITACGNGSMTFQTPDQGGTCSKWKAGHNYLILFMYL